MTKTVRSVERKKYNFCREGFFLAAYLSADRMAYRRNRDVRPIAASSFVRGSPCSQWMKTKYVEARVSNPEIPIRAGNCPTAILSAEPVMNAEIDTRGIRSTIQPIRIRPMKKMTHPEMTANAVAISALSTLGWLFDAATRILPTRVEATATGYNQVNSNSAIPGAQNTYTNGDIF